jgi:hypothetical protein
MSPYVTLRFATAGFLSPALMPVVPSQRRIASAHYEPQPIATIITESNRYRSNVFNVRFTTRLINSMNDDLMTSRTLICTN